MQLNQILNSVETLKKLADEDLSAKTAFRIGKAIKAVNAELEQFEETKRKLFEKYGEEVEGQLQIKQENAQDFQKEFNDLLAEEVALECKIKLDDLENIKLKPVEINNIDWLVEE